VLSGGPEPAPEVQRTDDRSGGRGGSDDGGRGGMNENGTPSGRAVLTASGGKRISRSLEPAATVTCFA
jgi:hypothetical protein